MTTRDDTLRTLAENVGLMLTWTDSSEQPRELPPERQRDMLTRLGWPASSDAEVAESLDRWYAARHPTQVQQLPPLLIADQGCGYRIGLARPEGIHFVLHQEDGATLEGRLDATGCLPPVAVPGYHRLTLLQGDGKEGVNLTLAVAPSRCFGIADLPSASSASPSPAGAPWGITVQLYALRRDDDAGIGDLQALASLSQALAAQGADALGISPVHALFGAHPERFSPYSPSSRLFYNVWHAAPEGIFDDETVARATAPFVEEMAAAARGDLIDWPASVKLKMAVLERLFVQLQRDESAIEWRSRFVAFRRDGGDSLERHCRFEVLLAHADDPDWRRWPDAWRRPDSAEIEAFAETHREAVTFVAFLQWLTAVGLERVQQNALEAGMAIGLIADIAVGADPAGSQAWSHPETLLGGFSVGAPPDAFNALGQDWGVAAFSPDGLRASGYRGFIDMLRAGFAHAGGVRIDHILGFSRLWLVPEGASADAGAYLRFPFDDLMRLLALESWRHRAIVIGEDLGTVEPGLRERLAARGVLGMSVLWFEREGDHYLPREAWRRDTAATTSTHDLPTVAGWWEGRDLAWRERLDLLAPDESAESLQAMRERDRRELVSCLGHGLKSQSPAEAVVDAALEHVAATPTALALLPLEDVLGLEEQANLPGTLETHPNWRRRLPVAAERSLAEPGIRERLARVNRHRSPTR
ncbi:4-alpha-glucanotransferase [Salinicola avicenniae]|uniref:4-alpha-glucanotransferase n=1 Tax=Salinicola avicenniae TaxID=2916836 RepID=UPI0020749C97|nr:MULTISPECIES: 4-alpha-glucanotransferase [unclassified Salinicola]